MKLCAVLLPLLAGLPCLVRAEVDEYNVPDGLEACARMEKDVALDDRMNPFYMSADFDGNKRTDYVALIVEVSTRKLGFLVCLSGPRGQWRPIRLGAGTEVALEGGIKSDELEGFDAWKLMDHAVQGAIGPGLHLIGKEAGSGVFYWRNGRFRWRQLGI